MRSSEIESEHGIDNIVSSTFMPMSIPWPCPSRVALFSPVYNQAMRVHCWRGDALGQDVRQHHQRRQALLQELDPLEHGVVGAL
jgi:hypothetical protein